MLGMYNSDFHNMYSLFNDGKRITDDAIPPLDMEWDNIEQGYQYIDAHYALAYFIMSEHVHEYFLKDAIKSAIRAYMQNEGPEIDISKYVDTSVIDDTLTQVSDKERLNIKLMSSTDRENILKDIKSLIKVLMQYQNDFENYRVKLSKHLSNDNCQKSSKPRLTFEVIYGGVICTYLPAIIFSFITNYNTTVKSNLCKIKDKKKITNKGIDKLTESLTKPTVSISVSQKQLKDAQGVYTKAINALVYASIYNSALRSCTNLNFKMAFIWFERHIGTYQYYLKSDEYAKVINHMCQYKSDMDVNVDISLSMLMCRKFIKEFSYLQYQKCITIPNFKCAKNHTFKCPNNHKLKCAKDHTFKCIEDLKFKRMKHSMFKCVAAYEDITDFESILNDEGCISTANEWLGVYRDDNDCFISQKEMVYEVIKLIADPKYKHVLTVLTNFMFYNDILYRTALNKRHRNYIFKCESIISDVYTINNAEFDLWIVKPDEVYPEELLKVYYNEEFSQLCPGISCNVKDVVLSETMPLCIIKLTNADQVRIYSVEAPKRNMLCLTNVKFNKLTVHVPESSIYSKSHSQYNHSLWEEPFKQINGMHEGSMQVTFGLNYYLNDDIQKSPIVIQNVAALYVNGYINYNNRAVIPDHHVYNQLRKNLKKHMKDHKLYVNNVGRNTIGCANGCSSPIVSDTNTTEISSANEKRRQWAASDAARDAKIPMPTNITQVVDIVYAKSATEHEKQYHLADIYYPQEMSADSYPVIVSIHGGGWFYGDKELYSRYTKYLAEQGFAVVNFNYRLAPEYKYPCGFSDICRLMDYISQNAEQYKLDLSRLYMVGDSAGAQLVSQYAIYATNFEYRKLFDGLNELDASIPAKVALNCGVYELSDNDECVAWYLPEEMSEDIQRSTKNILEYMNDKFPETFLMVSVNDDLCSCSDIMKSKLEELEIPHTYEEYGHSDPSAGHVFHINIISDEATQCNSDEIKFFNKK